MQDSLATREDQERANVFQALQVIVKKEEMLNLLVRLRVLLLPVLEIRLRLLLQLLLPLVLR